MFLERVAFHVATLFPAPGLKGPGITCINYNEFILAVFTAKASPLSTRQYLKQQNPFVLLFKDEIFFKYF